MANSQQASSGAALIFSAPSGCGKTTIINRLRDVFPQLGFSVSATSRIPRRGELHGREYYFFSPVQFQEAINRGDFLEWQEVYSGSLYGTLRAEVHRMWRHGQVVLFDIDVKGALNLKRELRDAALTIFIAPPSLGILKERLEGRGTETPEVIAKRLARAEEEMEYARLFDVTIVNDQLDLAVVAAKRAVAAFLDRRG